MIDCDISYSPLLKTLHFHAMKRKKLGQKKTKKRYVYNDDKNKCVDVENGHTWLCILLLCILKKNKSQNIN